MLALCFRCNAGKRDGDGQGERAAPTTCRPGTGSGRITRF
ncbi:hypothetical protein [Synechococcus sp. EJ6-Ellesmere]